MPSATLLVVDDPRHWRFPSEGVEIRSARDYLSTASSAQTAGARVFNLCDSYAYQSLGYYVSLLAEARGDRAIPSVATLRDFRSTAIARAFSAEIENTIRKSLKTETGNEFTLSIYFGQTLDKNHEKLGAQLYRLFPAPLMLAEFQRQKNWNLTSVLPLSANQIPESHVERVAEFGRLYFQGRHRVQRPKQRFLFDLAILVNPDEPCPHPTSGR